MFPHSQFRNYSFGLLILFVVFFFVVSLFLVPPLVRGSSHPYHSSSSSQQFVASTSFTVCPHVMHRCPDGSEVPLLPENRCQPRCPITLPKPTPPCFFRPVSPLPRPSFRPFPRPTPIRTPLPSSTPVCNPRPPVDIVCLGGMPLELDPVTCTYRCRDYRSLF